MCIEGFSAFGFDDYHGNITILMGFMRKKYEFDVFLLDRMYICDFWWVMLYKRTRVTETARHIIAGKNSMAAIYSYYVNKVPPGYYEYKESNGFPFTHWNGKNGKKNTKKAMGISTILQYSCFHSLWKKIYKKLKPSLFLSHVLVTYLINWFLK